MDKPLLLAAALLLPSLAHPAVAEPVKPNILWILAEDFGPHLGCYGTQEVWSPHLDRLAAEGVRFERAFTTAPVCSASRSAFITGMYQTSIGAQNHRSNRDPAHPLPAGVRVLTDWLRDAGYFTANVREFPAPITFRGAGKTDWNFYYAGAPFDSDRWTDLKAHQPFLPRSTSPRLTARPVPPPRPAGLPRAAPGRSGEGRHPALLPRLPRSARRLGQLPRRRLGPQ